MIYPALLEGDFERLPLAIRKFHCAPGQRRASGVMSIRWENGFLAWLVGFPPAGEVAVKLEVAAAEDEETWTRWFGGLRRRSKQWAEGRFLMEQSGPVRIAFRIRACESGMRFESHRARLWGLPIPLRIEADLRGGEISWDVEVKIAHVGSYRGVMTPT